MGLARDFRGERWTGWRLIHHLREVMPALAFEKDYPGERLVPLPIIGGKDWFNGDASGIGTPAFRALRLRRILHAFT